METFKCSICNLEKTVAKSGAVGYGLDKSGNKICYACCATLDLESMLQTGRATLYLGERNKTVSNWPGTLEIRVRSFSRGKHNLGKTRIDVWFSVSGDDYLWHGWHAGEWNTIVHCKRTKTLA